MKTAQSTKQQPSMHSHGNCELCDEQERKLSQLVRALRFLVLSAVWDGTDKLTGRREYTVQETEIEQARAVLKATENR